MRLPDWFVLLRHWRLVHQAVPNILSPKTFNEKILCRILFDRRPVLTLFADKAAVRGYVEARLGRDVLPKLYHLTDDPSDIPFDALPDRFVVKPTHGQGWVRLVTDKAALDREGLVRQCHAWLKDSLYERTREWAYKAIKPQILVEEFVDDGNAVPLDYKFFVFDGVVKFLHMDTGRFIDHRRRFYTPDWAEIEGEFGGRDKVAEPAPPPANLAKMIRAAEILGQGIDFVRADFYDTGSKIYFGELTMTPGAGYNHFRPKALDHRFGALWNLCVR